MTRGDKKLVRRLRRAARRAWKKLPRARRRRERRARGRFVRHYSLSQLRLGLPVLIFLFIAAPDIALGPLVGLLALHSVLAALRFAASLSLGLRDPANLAMSYWLPIEDRRIFSRQTRPMRFAAFALGADWLALGLGLAAWRGHSGWWIAGPLLALAQAGLAASAGLLLARIWPDRRWTLFHYFASCGIGAFVLFGRHVSDASTAWGGAAVDFFRRATPFGLFANGAHLAATRHPVLHVWLAVVAVATVGLAWRLHRRWRDTYSTAFLAEQPPRESPSAVADDSTLAPAPERTVAPPPRPAEPRPERSAAFDNPYDREILARELRLRLDYDPGEAYASQGPFERLFARLWSARQRRLLSLYGPPPSRWHRRLGVALVFVVIGAALAAFGFGQPAGLIGAGIGFALLLPAWETRWGALWALNPGPARSPVHGHLPVSLHSLAGAYWSQAYAKIILAGAVLVGGLLPWIGAGEALHYGALGCCLGMTWAPLAFLFSLSAGTNDSSARWWHAVLLVVFGLVPLIAGVALLVVAFSVEDPRVMAVCAGLAIVGANALLLAYLWVAGRRLFDLMPLVRR